MCFTGTRPSLDRSKPLISEYLPLCCFRCLVWNLCDRYHDADEMRKVEELGVSILGSLFKFCTGERLERLVYKFEENECEKIDRLCELYCRYDKQSWILTGRKVKSN